MHKQITICTGSCCALCHSGIIFALNTLGPIRNTRRFADDIFKCIFLNENELISIKISLLFISRGPISNIPSHYLKQWWLDYWRIYASLGLNHRGRVKHICDAPVNRVPLVQVMAWCLCAVPSHYRNQWRLIVNWTTRASLNGTNLNTPPCCLTGIMIITRLHQCLWPNLEGFGIKSVRITYLQIRNRAHDY